MLARGVEDGPPSCLSAGLHVDFGSCLSFFPRPFQMFCQVLSFGERALSHIKFCFRMRAPISVFIFSPDIKRQKGGCGDISIFSDSPTADSTGGRKTKEECCLDQSQGLGTRNCNRRTSPGFRGNPQHRWSTWMPVG